eukprot:Gb_13223 [translate_table: standard]
MVRSSRFAIFASLLLLWAMQGQLAPLTQGSLHQLTLLQAIHGPNEDGQNGNEWDLQPVGGDCAFLLHAATPLTVTYPTGHLASVHSPQKLAIALGVIFDMPNFMLSKISFQLIVDRELGANAMCSTTLNKSISLMVSELGLNSSSFKQNRWVL